MELDIEKMSPTELWEYAEGLRDNGDYKQAAKYMKKAARMGEILAQDSLAGYYEKGIGVQQDYVKAADLYAKVARSRKPGVFDGYGMPKTPHCKAAYALGRLHEEGLLPNASVEEAGKWYKRSAELGEAGACLKLAEFYLEGRGVEQDYLESLHYTMETYYCNMSFDGTKIFYLCQNLQGKLEGFEGTVLSMLADCYEMGWGVEKDEGKAKEYHEKAQALQIIEQGFGEEQDGGFSF